MVAWFGEVEHKAASRSALERASELEQAADAHAIGRLVGQAHHQRNVTRPLLALGQVGSLTQVGQRLLRPAARALHVGPIERTCILERLVERGLLARQLQHLQMHALKIVDWLGAHGGTTLRGALGVHEAGGGDVRGEVDGDGRVLALLLVDQKVNVQLHSRSYLHRAEGVERGPSELLLVDEPAEQSHDVFALLLGRDRSDRHALAAHVDGRQTPPLKGGQLGLQLGGDFGQLV